jgi:hypothetical protein
MSTIVGETTPDTQASDGLQTLSIWARITCRVLREADSRGVASRACPHPFSSRFQADADLDGRIIRGLRRAAHKIDIGTAADAKLEGLSDADVLRILADPGRLLVSQDRRTMPAHFARYAAAAQSPGVILLRGAIPVATAIDELLLIWSASEAEEWIGRLVWIPL